MKIIARILVLFYVILILFISLDGVLFVANLIDFPFFSRVLYLVFTDNTLRAIVGGLAVVMLCVNFMFYRLFLVNLERGKIIAFDNPSGRVSLSLLALEDVLKRMLEKLNEIKDVKLLINPSKKGLLIKIKLVIFSELNIPEITYRVQDLVKKKIQDTIGVEGNIDVCIYIGKILPVPQREKVPGEIKSEAIEPQIPFRGYRA